MRKFISEKKAAVAVISILCIITVFHVLVITGVIPYTIVWGGRLKSSEQMYRFEAASILVNILMICIVVLRLRAINLGINRKVITIFLWALTILFSLNTIGNVLSQNKMEMIIFTPLTFILALLCVRLAIGENRN